MISTLLKRVKSLPMKYILQQSTPLYFKPKNYFCNPNQITFGQNADQMLEQGMEAFNKQNYRQSIQSFEMALEMEIEENEKGHIRTLDPLLNLGAAYHIQGNQEKAYENCLLSLEIINSNEITSYIKFKTLAYLGSISTEMGQKQKAMDYIGQAYNMYNPEFSVANLECTQLFTKMGISLRKFEKFEDAIQFHKEALGIYQAEFGENSPLLYFDINKIGENLVSLGKNDEGVKWLRKGLKIQEKVQGANSLHWEPLISISQGLKEMGLHEEAMLYLFTALQKQESVLGGQHYESISTILKIGNLYFEMGDFPKAKLVYENILTQADFSEKEELKTKVNEKIDELKIYYSN